eukprot:7339984-Lingulodinium_polyedra.AAC.1
MPSQAHQRDPCKRAQRALHMPQPHGPPRASKAPRPWSAQLLAATPPSMASVPSRSCTASCTALHA